MADLFLLARVRTHTTESALKPESDYFGVCDILIADLSYMRIH